MRPEKIANARSSSIQNPSPGREELTMSKIEDDELQDLPIARAARTAAKELKSTTKELESILNEQKQSQPGHVVLKEALLEKQAELLRLLQWMTH
jgi:hypothetical protein